MLYEEEDTKAQPFAATSSHDAGHRFHRRTRRSRHRSTRTMATKNRLRLRVRNETHAGVDVRSAQCNFWLERIVERGTHDTLLSANGLYAHLYEIQFRDKEEQEARSYP